MINWIGSWVQGIVIAVVISTIIEMILPDGNIKKYVRTVIGVYIVFVIISPIITKITGKEINLKLYELPETTTVQPNVIDTNTYIESTYINKLKQDIIENIETKGYKVININIGIEQKETGYGNINKIWNNAVEIMNEYGKKSVIYKSLTCVLKHGRRSIKGKIFLYENDNFELTDEYLRDIRVKTASYKVNQFDKLNKFI